MKRFGTLIAAAVLGSMLTIGTFNLFEEKQQIVKVEHQDSTPASKIAYSVDANGDVVPLDFTLAAEKVTKAVVHIRSTTIKSSPAQTQDPFREFFNPHFKGNPRPQTGSGSGVIINETGYIVTNNHVIEDADDIEVTLHDNRSYKAKVIGTDPLSDLALIKIEEKGLPNLVFADSDKIKIGEWVLAVGNPFNLTSTVTAGIISAKARSIGIISRPNAEGYNEGIESFIQTDAAVNPGNSGGALVNLDGTLIGINTAIASPTGSFSGYSFAVPANIAKRVVEDLIEFGVVQRGWLGVHISDIDDKMAKENDLDVLQGAYILSTVENSAASEAGLKTGDVIVKVDDITIKTNSDVIGYISQHRPGDKVTVTVNRFGKEQEFVVTLKNSEGTMELIEKNDDLFTRLGADFEEVDIKTLKRLGISHGVRVKSLKNGILTKETSLREGFIITHIAGVEIKRPDDIEKSLSNAKGGVLIEGRYEEYNKTEYYALGIN